MSETGLDYYLLRPWDPAEERQSRYDLCIVGGGSAGLAAGVQAASAVGDAMLVYLVHRYLATI